MVQVTMKRGESHLVAIIKGGHCGRSDPKRGSKRRLVPEAEYLKLSSPWFLFNDFVVKNISEQEALSFQDKWKVRFL